MLLKIIAVQTRLGKKLSLEEKLLIFKQKPDFLCLPEYYFVSESDPDFARSALRIKENLQVLKYLSESFSTCLIGGSIVEAEGDSLYNSSYLLKNGKILGKYRKLNPVAGEIDKGIMPGDKMFMADIDGVKISILICADALNIETFKMMAPHDIDIVFIPTTSPLRPLEMKLEKFKRDNDIYVAGARAASSYVIKTCGIGTLFDKPLQGRSLIASPWGVIRRVEPLSENTACILTGVVDVDELRDFRMKHRLIAEELKDMNKLTG